ncbi:ribbon-helix-helix protein, CopG family [Pseudomonas sp. P7]|uniref:Ribbon-helix-helix protein, CopG family n=3 Tax=Pseudomonas TaxID=286 RepID=A0ABS1H1P5_9PSED|nr:ribbon-helix-helix protein, CopG family [Pseudomonas proteolytica]MBA2926870.1 ribbon-helix-helix protein, CopG family [Pseudomonas sivasensis]MBK3463042.1 ribbon-helix-helix protein, CopG family [Pseudomonas haemolytica]TWR75155.1 ribbon-helix-helix protein, CopG family [Pseudomonas proteolytica]SEC69335.1 Ribbon-helix-helix protein, copG family [Pseudomonas proteolytica]
MTSSAPSSIMATKVDESIKRRFDAAMRARGTTTSAVLREAIYRYLNELDAGEEHPQCRLDLDSPVGRGK